MIRYALPLCVVLAIAAPSAALAVPSVATQAGAVTRTLAQAPAATDTRVAIILQRKPPAKKKGR